MTCTRPTEFGAITRSALFCLKVFVGTAGSVIGRGTALRMPDEYRLLRYEEDLLHLCDDATPGSVQAFVDLTAGENRAQFTIRAGLQQIAVGNSRLVTVREAGRVHAKSRARKGRRASRNERGGMRRPGRSRLLRNRFVLDRYALRILPAREAVYPSAFANENLED